MNIKTLMEETVLLSEFLSLKHTLELEKDRSDFLNKSCKKYLCLYEKSKREIEGL